VTNVPALDGVLVQWGERLFYPGNRIVKAAPLPRLHGNSQQRAAAIRRRIVATVARRAPQVMVKVTGGGRGMGAIAAHFRYISKNGRLDIEDDLERTHQGTEALGDLAEQWRLGGSLIDEVGYRREAFNIMLSMPKGTDAQLLKVAAREFAAEELREHRWVMVLHEHQANPHVHLSVRAEAIDGTRLNPRKADLHRWRETFAQKLRGWGIDAEASRQATRGATQRYDPLWRMKAREDGRLRQAGATGKSGQAYQLSRDEAMTSWSQIALALEQSADGQDKALAQGIRRFLDESPYMKELGPQRSFNGPIRPSTPDRSGPTASAPTMDKDPTIER